MMGRLAFIGLGLYDLRDISLGALEYLKGCSYIYMEDYTSLLPGFKKEKLEEIIGKKIILLSRKDLEEDFGKKLWDSVKYGDVALICIGDPFIATTHIALRLEAVKRNIETLVFPSSSIFNGMIASTGLHIYKFSRPVTLTFIEERYRYYPLTAYHILEENLRRGLHTLFLLDIKKGEKRIMSISDAIDVLLRLEEIERRDLIKVDRTIGIGIARSTAPDEEVFADFLIGLKKHDFGDPPHVLVIPSLLHETEIESLYILGKVDRCKLDKWNNWIRQAFRSKE